MIKYFTKTIYEITKSAIKDNKIMSQKDIILYLFLSTFYLFLFAFVADEYPNLYYFSLFLSLILSVFIFYFPIIMGYFVKNKKINQVIKIFFISIIILTIGIFLKNKYTLEMLFVLYFYFPLLIIFITDIIIKKLKVENKIILKILKFLLNIFCFLYYLLFTLLAYILLQMNFDEYHANLNKVYED